MKKSKTIYDPIGPGFYWELHFIGSDARFVSTTYGIAPNAFYRFVQRFLCGMKWVRREGTEGFSNE